MVKLLVAALIDLIFLESISTGNLTFWNELPEIPGRLKLFGVPPQTQIPSVVAIIYELTSPTPAISMISPVKLYPLAGITKVGVT